MDFQEVVKNRHSARSFTDQAIEKEKLEELISLAQWVPSWCNTQAWKVYIATGDTLEAIRKDHMESYMNEVPSNAVWPTPSRSSFKGQVAKNMQDFYTEVGTVLKGDMEAFAKASASLFNAQAIAYLAIPKDSTPWTYYDLGGLGTALVLNAANLGIDSLPAYEFVKYPDHLKKFLNVDPDYDIVMGIGLGYADQNAVINQARSARQPLEDFLTIQD